MCRKHKRPGDVDFKLTEAMRTPLRMIAIRPADWSRGEVTNLPPALQQQTEWLGKTKHSNMRALFRKLLREQLSTCYYYPGI